MQYHRNYYGISTMKVRRCADERSDKAKRWLVAAVAVLLVAAMVFGYRAITPQRRLIDSARLRSEIMDALAGHNGVYGVYVRVIETGEEFKLNDGPYIAGSCFKLPLSLLVYELAASGELGLDAEVMLRPEDWEEGTGVLQYARPGAMIQLRKLVELCIVESDNVAANALLRLVGKQRFIQYQQVAGAKVVPSTQNVSSPSDLGRFAARLVTFAQKNSIYGGELLSYFAGNRFKDRLPAKLPKGVEVANKIGTWPGHVNDVALVACDKVSYVIAVMSRGISPTTEAGARALQDISAAVYHHIVARIPDDFSPGVLKKTLAAIGR